MNVLMLLRSELRRSAAVLAGIAAVLALSLSISIATGMTDRMLRHASAQAADRFDLLIGAKASPSSLLLGAVFLALVERDFTLLELVFTLLDA